MPSELNTERPPSTKAVSHSVVHFTLLFVCVFAASMLSDYVNDSWMRDSSGNVSESDSRTSPGGDTCNVTGLEIRDCLNTYIPDSANDSSSFGSDDGCDMYTSSEEIAGYLESAASNQNIKAVLLQIDSSGGAPVAAEEMVNAVQASGKPSVAWIRSIGASAAYWIASAADTIVASANSDVGSIGVSFSYVDNAVKNAKEGLTYNQLTTGKYKDSFSPERALTADERVLIQRDLDIVNANFIQTVATNRNLSPEKVRSLADGSTLLGVAAKEKGLIDIVGSKKEVMEALEAKIGEKPVVCWPQYDK